MPQGGSCCCGDNRESGGSPERSGHCEQGVLSWDAIAWRDHVRRFDKAMICESGNLLGKLVMSFRRKQNSKRWESSDRLICCFSLKTFLSVVVSDSCERRVWLQTFLWKKGNCSISL